MGCYNLTGFQSQLPILAGDEIFLIFGIYRPSEEDNYFSPGNQFTPISLPIFGKYNEYGGIEDIQETENTKYLTDLFGEDLENVVSTLDYEISRWDPQNQITEYKEILDRLLPRMGIGVYCSDFDTYRDIISFTIDHSFFYEAAWKSGEISEETWIIWMKKLFEDREKKKRMVDTLKNLASRTDLSEELVKYVSGFLEREAGFPMTTNYNNLNPADKYGVYYGSSEYHRGDIFLSTYSGSDILFETLSSEYRKFLSFYEFFMKHSWILRRHNYCNQEDHTSGLLGVYQEVVNFIKNRDGKL